MDEPTNKDLEAIEELHRQDVAATKAGDYETLMSLMDEECIVFPPDSEPEDGRAYLSRFRASSDSIEPEPKILEFLQDWEEVRLLGEFAYEQGIVRYAVRDASGAILRETQRLVRLLRRQPDGEWRVLRACFGIFRLHSGSLVRIIAPYSLEPCL
jgi:ketosteroid isomerase-like protein